MAHIFGDCLQKEKTMKNCFKLALAAFAVATLSTGARADLNAFGEVGLPINPTAQIPEEGGIRVQGNYFDLGEDSKLYGLTAAGRVADNFEISGGVHRFDIVGDKETGFTLGAKYLITKETDPAKVRFAVGGGILDVDDLSAQRVYGVATKYLGKVTEGKAPITGHLGVRYDRVKVSGGDSDGKVSGFVGVEVPFADAFNVVGEYGTKVVDGGKAPYSISLRYRQKDQPIGASIGFQRFGILSSDAKLFAQVGYTFGK